MHRSFFMPIALLTASACEYDSACKPLLEHAPQLRQRLIAAEEYSESGKATIGLKRVLNADIAKRFLQEADLLETQLPATAEAEDLDLLVRKLSTRRAAFEQALRDFLASGAGQANPEDESGDTVPLRRGIEMSRTGIFDLADTAAELCRSRQ